MQQITCYIVLCCVMVLGSCEISSIISCKVDYRGIIHFHFEIPIHLRTSSNISLYYKHNDIWHLKKGCIISLEYIYKCPMNIPLQQNEHLSYTFSLIICLGNTVYNITQFNSTRKMGNNVLPWKSTRSSFLECDDSFGTKQMALTASTRNISVNWVLYPLTVLYSNDLTNIKLIINGDERYQSSYIDVFCDNNDICNYLISELKPCSKYDVCVKTEFGRKVNSVCKFVNTYCVQKASNSLDWKTGILIVFGTIIALVFFGIFAVLINRYRNRLLFTEIDDDTVVPRRGDIAPSCLDVANINIYHYPHALAISEANVREVYIN